MLGFYVERIILKGGGSHQIKKGAKDGWMQPFKTLKRIDHVSLYIELRSAVYQGSCTPMIILKIFLDADSFQRFVAVK